MSEMTEPTLQQKKLAKWADMVEHFGPKTSLYYRLLPQIAEARAVIAKARREGS